MKVRYTDRSAAAACSRVSVAHVRPRPLFCCRVADSSFLALLNKLAHLELPNRGSEMEDCPICSVKFTLADFAAHVYMCIKVSRALLCDALRTAPAAASLTRCVRFLLVVASRNWTAKKSSSRSDWTRSWRPRWLSPRTIARTPVDTAGAACSRTAIAPSRLRLWRRRRSSCWRSLRATRRNTARTENSARGQRGAAGAQVARDAACCSRLSAARPSLLLFLSFRTDFKHFVLKWHPEVGCPLCGAFFAVPEVNAHVTLCLDMPKESKSPSAIKKQNSDAMGDASMNGSSSSSSKPAGGIFSSAPVQIPSHAGLSAAAAAAAASGHAGIPARRAGTRKLGQRSASASGMGSGSQQDDLFGSPPLDDDDDAEADDELDLDDAPAPPQRSSGGMLAPTSAAAAASSSASGGGGPLHRSTSDCSLSLAQAAAVASLVLKKRGAGAPSGAVKTGEKDPSLLELLNTFSSLGFTRQNLEALHAQHQKEQDEKGGAGGNAM